MIWQTLAVRGLPLVPAGAVVLAQETVNPWIDIASYGVLGLAVIAFLTVKIIPWPLYKAIIADKDKQILEWRELAISNLSMAEVTTDLSSRLVEQTQGLVALKESVDNLAKKRRAP